MSFTCATEDKQSQNENGWWVMPNPHNFLTEFDDWFIWAASHALFLARGGTEFDWICLHSSWYRLFGDSNTVFIWESNR